MSENNNTRQIILLSCYYVILFILYQIILYEWSEKISFDRFSSLIFIIIIILPLSLLFSEIQIYGFKFKKEFDEFKESVFEKLNLFQTTLIQANLKQVSSQTLSLSVYDGKVSDQMELNTGNIDKVSSVIKEVFEGAKK